MVNRIARIACLCFLLHGSCTAGWWWDGVSQRDETRVGQVGEKAINIVVHAAGGTASAGGSASSGAASAAGAQQAGLSHTPEVGAAADWINNNRRKTFIISVLVLYVWAQYRLWGGRLLMHKKSAWCNWQDPLTAENISQLAPEVLAKILVDAILMRYELQSTSFVSNVGVFFNATDEELGALRTFVDTASTLQAMHLSWLFGFDQVSIERAQGCVRKLMLMRQVVSKQLDQIKREQIRSVRA